MNILAVDDEYYALELMKHALEEVAGGATVYLCRDVRAALQTASEITVDVAFLDIHMPAMSGIELARELNLSLCVGGVNGCTLSNSSYTETNNMSNLTNSAPITVEDCAQFSGHSNNAYFRVGGVSAWIQHTLNDCVNNKEGVINIKNTTVYNKQSDLNGFCIGGVVGYKTVFVANNCTNEAEINVDLTTTGDNTMTNAGYNCVNIGGVLGWRSDKTGDNLVNV